MSRNRFEERNIRKLTKVAGGTSYGVTFPIEYVREFKWREHQKLIMKKQGNKLVIEDWEGYILGKLPLHGQSVLQTLYRLPDIL